MEIEEYKTIKVEIESLKAQANDLENKIESFEKDLIEKANQVITFPKNGYSKKAVRYDNDIFDITSYGDGNYSVKFIETITID